MSKEIKKYDIKNKIQNLKTNPVFNMSLSGKELFHSNMLAMFLLDKVTETREPSDLAFALRELFKPKLGPKERIQDYRVFDVQREKGNRDLIIIYVKKDDLKTLEDFGISEIEDFSDETFNSIENWKLNYEDTKTLHKILNDFRYVVIENKFKSYPYKEQLEKYNKEISLIPNLPIYNDKGDKLEKRKQSVAGLTKDNTNYYLFAPKMTLDLFCEKNEYGYSKTVELIIPSKNASKTVSTIWKGIPYDDDNTKKGYLNILEKVKIQNQFMMEFKSHYCKYTKEILAICKTTINDHILNNNKFNFSYEESLQLANGRIHDICQKILSNYLLDKLEKEIKEIKTYEKKNNLVLTTGYEHQLGLLDFRFMNQNSENPIYHGIQIQGSSFGIFVVAMYDKIDEANKETKKKKINELTNKFTSSENQKRVKKWIEDQFKEIKKEFNSISNNKITQTEPQYNKKTKDLFGYTKDDKYCHRYESINLNDLAEAGDFRNIDYSTVKTLLEVSLKVLSKTSFSLE